MNVTVKVEYHGLYAKQTGTKLEILTVSENIEQAYQYLIKYFKEKYGFEPPFILLIGSVHIIGAVKQSICLKDGDVFTLLPFMSGG